MERSFASLAGFEHEAELVTGYDDLVSHHEHQTPKTPEAVYTETVLKLEAGTYGIIDGQEGFLDNIKRGANKVYEWIKSMIRAIRNWFSGNNKKEYTTAVAEVKNLNIESNFDKQLEKSLAEFDKHWSGALRDVSRHTDADTKKEIKEVVSEGVVELKNDAEKREKLIGTIVNEIAAKISTRLKQVEIRVKEIKRIDPTGETLENLGLSRSWNFITEAFETNVVGLSKENQANFAHLVKGIVDDSEDIQRELSKAVSGLEKINEATRNIEDNTENRKVARAGSIVKELSEIASIYRDTIVTISSQVQMGYKKAETSIVKSALMDALKHSDETANKYIQQAIDSL